MFLFVVCLFLLIGLFHSYYFKRINKLVVPMTMMTLFWPVFWMGFLKSKIDKNRDIK